MNMKQVNNCRIRSDGSREDTTMDELIARKRSEEQRNRMIGGDVCVRITVPILHEDHIYTAIDEFRRLANNLEEMVKGKTKMTSKLFCSRMHCRDTHLHLKRVAAEAIGEGNTPWQFRGTN